MGYSGKCNQLQAKIDMPRPKLDKENLHARVNPGTKETLEDIAGTLGMTYSGKGQTGQLFDLIAENREVFEPILNKLLAIESG